MCLDARDVLGWWTTDPVALGVVGVPSLVYAAGVRRLWLESGRGHGIRRWEVASFVAAQIVLALALLSPLDRLSDLLFSAHMTQHELVMIVAPPLAVLGRPWVAALWALPPDVRHRLPAWAKGPRVLGSFRAVSAPLVALVLHALVVWLWHLPSWFEGALASETIHAVQHATFYASAALFWWAILRGRYGRLGYGLATVFVFATAMHTSILGLLFTTMEGLAYPVYAARGVEAGVDAHDDQVLAGIVMWIPAGTVLTLAAAWLGEAGARVARAERSRAS
jgi:putative membrane protein